MRYKIIILFIVFLSTLISGCANIKTTGEAIATSTSGFDFAVVGFETHGKWIDAREQGSYHAYYPNAMREENGRMHMFYCSSGHPYDPNEDVDHRPTASYSADYIRHQHSDDDGITWSNATIVIQAFRENNQDDTYQNGCANAIIFFKGKYYLYFESYTYPTALNSIFVAISDAPGGPYEIWTEDGWKLNPTNSTWKPVISPKILITPEFEEYAHQNSIFYDYVQREPQYLNPTTMSLGGMRYHHIHYGAGIPRVTQKDGQIYLYFVDTTYTCDVMPSGLIMCAYASTQMGAISNDPIEFPNRRRLKDRYGMAEQLTPKYFPEIGVFLGFSLVDKYQSYPEPPYSANGIVIKVSEDGIKFSDEGLYLADLPSGYDVGYVPGPHDNITMTATTTGVLSNSSGEASLSDLYLLVYKEYFRDDIPSTSWCYGYTDAGCYGGFNIHAFKINLKKIYDSWDNKNNDGQADVWDTNDDGEGDIYDSNGDGNPNSGDDNYDGVDDWWDDSGNGFANMWNIDQNNEDPDEFDTNNDGLADWFKEQCDSKDNDDDGNVDEGCDSDNDGYADSRMVCQGKFYTSHYSEEYKTLHSERNQAKWIWSFEFGWIYSYGNEASGWFHIQDGGFTMFLYEEGNGWAWRQFSCADNSNDINDEIWRVH